MGRRVHVIKKVEEIGGSEYFNWSYDDFVNLLENLGCSVYKEEDVDNGLTRFEMSKEEYVQAMEYLKDLESIKDNEELDYDDVMDCIDGLAYKVEEIIGIMEIFLKECDKETDYIHFIVF